MFNWILVGDGIGIIVVILNSIIPDELPNVVSVWNGIKGTLVPMSEGKIPVNVEKIFLVHWNIKVLFITVRKVNFNRTTSFKEAGVVDTVSFDGFGVFWEAEKITVLVFVPVFCATDLVINPALKKIMAAN